MVFDSGTTHFMGLVIEKLKLFGEKRGGLQVTVLEISLISEPKFGILNTLSGLSM